MGAVSEHLIRLGYFRLTEFKWARSPERKPCHYEPVSWLATSHRRRESGMRGQIEGTTPTRMAWRIPLVHMWDYHWTSPGQTTDARL